MRQALRPSLVPFRPVRECHSSGTQQGSDAAVSELHTTDLPCSSHWPSFPQAGLEKNTQGTQAPSFQNFSFYLQSLLKVTSPCSVAKLAAHCLAVGSARSLSHRVAASASGGKQFCLTPDLVYVGQANWRCLALAYCCHRWSFSELMGLAGLLDVLLHISLLRWSIA